MDDKSEGHCIHRLRAESHSFGAHSMVDYRQELATYLVFVNQMRLLIQIIIRTEFHGFTEPLGYCGGPGVNEVSLWIFVAFEEFGPMIFISVGPGRGRRRFLDQVWTLRKRRVLDPGEGGETY